MLQTLSIIAPLFLLIGLGFAARWGGLLERDQVRGIGSFVIHFALPALLFKSLAERPLQEILDFRYLLAYSLGSLAVFAFGFAVARLRHASLESAAIGAMGMSVSNSGFIGYPVAVMVIGPPAALAMTLGILVESLVMMPLALALADLGRQGGGAPAQLALATLRRLAQNPLILAIAAGLLCALAELRLPAELLRSIDMLSQASAPAALFVIGASLYGLRVRGMLADAGQIAVAKLLLHPLGVALALALIPGIAPTMQIAGVLFASAPMFSVYPLLGMRYGQEERCVAALVMTTALSFFSIALVLALRLP